MTEETSSTTDNDPGSDLEDAMALLTDGSGLQTDQHTTTDPADGSGDSGDSDEDEE